MFYSDFTKYSSHYRKGIQHIKFRTVELKIRTRNLHLLTNKGIGNIEVEYSKDSRLLFVEDFVAQKPVKTHFSYDKRNQLISALSLYSSGNNFFSITTFEFDTQNRITKEILQKLDPENNTIQRKTKQHAYFSNVEKVWLFSDHAEEPESEIAYTYNNENLIIEEKSIILAPGEKEFCMSYYYDKTGNLIKQIFVGENIKRNAEIEFNSPFIDKKPSGRSIKTAKGTDRIDFEYTLNERGHYINIVFIRDGNPQSILERIIDYYK